MARLRSDHYEVKAAFKEYEGQELAARQIREIAQSKGLKRPEDLPRHHGNPGRLGPACPCCNIDSERIFHQNKSRPGWYYWVIRPPVGSGTSRNVPNTTMGAGQPQTDKNTPDVARSGFHASLAARQQRSGPASAPGARDLVSGLQATLKTVGIDYEQTIKEMGAVTASEDRLGGRRFSLSDHLRGLLLSLLSNSRPWKPIADNLQQIGEILLNYDPGALERADPSALESKLRAIGCGNRAIRNQMRSLRANIETLRRIEREFGGLDRFVTSGRPLEVAGKLSEYRPYKLQCVGMALALEYLRNVGIRAAKPDIHMRRILQRLGYVATYPGEEVAALLVDKLASEAECNTTYLDNLLWLMCSTGYGNVCNASPRCGLCAFSGVCSYPPRPS